MNPGSALLITVLKSIDWILSAIVWFVFVWVILSWIVFFMSQSSFRWRYSSAFNIFVQLNDILTSATRPILRPFRRILPPHKTGGIDWSPLLLLLAVYFIRTFIRLAFGPILFV